MKLLTIWLITSHLTSLQLPSIRTFNIIKSMSLPMVQDISIRKIVVMLSILLSILLFLIL